MAEIRDRNLLPNSYFEEVSNVDGDYPKHWTEINTSNDVVYLKYLRDTDNEDLGTVEPKTSLRMCRVGSTTSSNLSGDGIQTLFKTPVKASTSYTATAWLKTWLTASTDKANIQILFYDILGAQTDSTQTGSYVYGKSDWSTSTKTATSPSDADTALIQIVGTGTGIYYIDSVGFYEASMSYLTSTNVNSYTGTTSTEYTSTDHTTYQPMAVAEFEDDVGMRLDISSDKIRFAEECIAHLCVHKKKVAVYGVTPDSDWGDEGLRDDTSYQTYRQLVYKHFTPESLVVKYPPKPRLI